MRHLSLMLVLLATLVFALPTAAQDVGHAPAEQTDAEQAGTLAEDGAHAADDEHAEHEKGGVIPTVAQGLVPAIVTLIVFLIVLYILSKTAWPRIVRGLEEREEKIKKEIMAAEEARQQARESLEDYEKALQEARAESKRILEETKAYQQEYAAELRAKADAELTQLKDRARRDIEAAKKAALNEIYAETASLATHVASKILEREISDADQERLVQEALREMQSVQN